MCCMQSVKQCAIDTASVSGGTTQGQTISRFVCCCFLSLLSEVIYVEKWHDPQERISVKFLFIFVLF